MRVGIWCVRRAGGDYTCKPGMSLAGVGKSSCVTLPDPARESGPSEPTLVRVDAVVLVPELEDVRGAAGKSAASVAWVVSRPLAVPARAPASGTRSIGGFLRLWYPDLTRLFETDSLRAGCS
jgi:hypothetical protein